MKLIFIVATSSVELQQGRESTRLTVLFLIVDKDVYEHQRLAHVFNRPPRSGLVSGRL
jgi:hypothetical protein